MTSEQPSDPLPAGKLSPEFIRLAFAGITGSGVLQGPGVGRDAAIVEWGDEALVATADPITFVDSATGRLAVTVNANDIHAVGAEPRWLLATILSPVGSSSAAIESLAADLRAACEESEIVLVGGHTEVTDAVNRTVVSCAMIGSAPREQIVRSDGARDGDVLIQAGAAAVEGTAILGHTELLDDPGISIAAAARALRSVAGLHAMHDVTEGGIATAALELAEAAGLGVELRADDMLWLPETMALCAERGLDPLGLLGSGTLLASVDPQAANSALAALHDVGVRGAEIGRVGAGITATLVVGGLKRLLPRFGRDEALRALAEHTSDQAR